MDAALVIDQLAQKLEIGVSDLHGWNPGRGLSACIGPVDIILEALNRQKQVYLQEMRCLVKILEDRSRKLVTNLFKSFLEEVLASI
jgi:hypothetical protein